MAIKSGNYTKDIHDANYEAPYLENRLDVRGLVSSAGRKSESLSGRWRFAADWYDSCRRASWYKAPLRDAESRPLPVDWDWESWGFMDVPSCWNLERAELLYFEGSGLYYRPFRYRPEREGERAFLRFEGVQYRCTVFLNGACLGTHDGGSTPFCAEITETVREDNKLIVVAEARRRSDRVPSENTDWFNYGGLYRDVLLLRTPAAFVKDFFLRLTPGRRDEISLDVEIDGWAGGGEARFSVPELKLEAAVPISEGRGKIRVAASPELWSPERPRLYEIEVSYGHDLVRDRIGFREIKAEGGEILLNGKPIFLKGICLHEDRLDTGKTTDEASIRAAISHLRELHGNYLRLAHYPHDERFARIADEEGVLLWEEVPVYWAIEFANPSTYEDAENQLAELVSRDRNRASVVIWSVGNENADSDERLSFMSRLAAKARALDGTRPVSAACLIDHEKLAIADRLAEDLDIIGINEYYGWYDPDFSKLGRILENSKPAKPVVICEFGADARSGERGSVQDMWTEDYQARLYERQIEVFRSCRYIKGTTPWILYDFRCPRRLNRYQEGFNRKGLVDADRKTKKLAFGVLAAYYAAIPSG
jgi:beta-glucuronidase